LDFFEYRDNRLFVEDVPVKAVVDDVGTPCYIYSLKTVRHHFARIKEAFSGIEHLVCFSIKANSNLSLLRELAALGSGFDVVSGGEIRRALEVGADPRKIVFAGVGKTPAEIDYALSSDILMFNVESAGELEAIEETARRRGGKASVAMRVNPDVDALTHGKIATGRKETKFGLDPAETLELAAKYADSPHVELVGLHAHIGSQITSVEPYRVALERIAEVIKKARAIGAPIRYLNAGGGFGINYQGGDAPLARRYAEVFRPVVEEVGCKLILEPGRFIVGNAGILVTRLLYVKKTPSKTFYIVDAAMNDLIRPTLYEAYHRVWPVDSPVPVGPNGEISEADGGRRTLVDVVGPVCETGDYLARERLLPTLARDDLLAVFSAGAYGLVMASNYNSRPRPPEVLADGDSFKVVRRRETYEDLVAPERMGE